MAGAEDYYHHGADWRNGTVAEQPMQCGDPTIVDDIYSTTLMLSEATRVVKQLRDKTRPLYLYLAFQNVHNPYEAPPSNIVNINETYPNVTSARQVYGGMVTALDTAVQQIVELYQEEGLWEDTVMIFTTDNGGIGPGNNYPLRGQKVLDWEGGVRGVSFVRGTDSAVAPLPRNETRNQLMHSTDWLPTLVEGIAGSTTENKTLPLDGFNQWSVLANNTATDRKMIIHNVPAKSKYVNITGQASTSTCIGPTLESSIEGCHVFGITGGAIRVEEFKLVKVGTESSNNPVGTPQWPPSGFKPTDHVDVVPKPENGWYLFNITADPSE
eukprot:gene9324-14455_t